MRAYTACEADLKELRPNKWFEAETKEELFRQLIDHETAAARIASEVVYSLLGSRMNADIGIGEMHDHMVTFNLGGPVVDFTVYYDDGDTELLPINLSWDAVRRD